MAEIFIYSTERLTDGRDEIEDELLEILKGSGEITGGGSGTNIWNIDIEIFNLSDLSKCCAQVVEYLNNRNICYKLTIHNEM